MTVEKLKRVMWRIRAKYPGQNRIGWRKLRMAIMVECGTWDRTYYANAQALVNLGWIKRDKKMIVLTGNDLTEDF